jgi:hypothetical protein
MVFALGGYGFGAAMRTVLDHVPYFEAWLIAGLVVVVMLASAIRRRIVSPSP